MVFELPVYCYTCCVSKPSQRQLWRRSEKGVGGEGGGGGKRDNWGREGVATGLVAAQLTVGMWSGISWGRWLKKGKVIEGRK